MTSQQTSQQTSRSPRGPLHRTLAGAAVTALALGVLAGCGDDASDRADDPAPAGSTSSPDSTEPGEPTTSDEPTGATSPGVTTEPDPGETSTVPVYYVGDSPMGPRLYREFRRVSGDPALGAADMVAAGVPADPDYRAAFPVDGSFSSVRLDEEAGLIIAQVPDDRWADMSRKQAKLAVQALVYTVQGALQSRAPVQVVGEPGGPAVPMFGVDTDGGVANADQLDVLALVSVTSPESGAEVSGTFTASGVASSFEATVPWEVRDSSGTVVLDGFSTAEGWMDRLYPWQSEVDVSGLAPGEYTFAAMTDDPSGGEGPGPFEDTKVISVG